MFGNFAKIDWAAYDKITHLDVNPLKHFIQVFWRTILNDNIIFSL